MVTSKTKFKPSQAQPPCMGAFCGGAESDGGVFLFLPPQGKRAHWGPEGVLAWSRFFNILKTHGVDRAAHHGGDLTGASIGILFNRSEAILGDFKAFLYEEVANCDRACDDTEINDVLKRFRELFVLCDYLFSLARTKTGAANDEILAKTTECIKAVMLKWRDLGMSMKMPKIHAVEDHLLWQMSLKTSSNRRTRLEEQKTIGQET
mgnify:CR=1 FL=1